GLAGPLIQLLYTSLGANPHLVGDGAGGVVYGTSVSPGGFESDLLEAGKYNKTSGVPGLFSAFNYIGGMKVMQLVRDAAIDVMCSDGNGGAIVFGHDVNLVPSQARAVRVDKWGALDGAAAITSVKDVANDQGGHVRLAWKASYLDRDLSPYVDSYRI